LEILDFSFQVKDISDSNFNLTFSFYFKSNPKTKSGDFKVLSLRSAMMDSGGKSTGCYRWLPVENPPAATGEKSTGGYR
jgi:hypothetical protein